LKEIGEAVRGINEQVLNANSPTAQESAGMPGFAQHVYDFIEMRTAECEGYTHRFFVFHPGTIWYPAFRKLRLQTPLPATYCAKSNNMESLVQLMQQMRAKMANKDVVFHLLMPAWAPISFVKPLHLPEDLQPLCIEGLEHNGTPYVSVNLPWAPAGLLHGVANILDH
jgi:hypothetical protein